MLNAARSVLKLQISSASALPSKITLSTFECRFACVWSPTRPADSDNMCSVCVDGHRRLLCSILITQLIYC
jgi:hypothetical protein